MLSWCHVDQNKRSVIATRYYKKASKCLSSILLTVLLRRDEMSLHRELREVIFGENLEMKMVWMQQRGLIASQKTCRKCVSDMRFEAMCDGWIR